MTSANPPSGGGREPERAARDGSSMALVAAPTVAQGRVLLPKQFTFPKEHVDESCAELLAVANQMDSSQMLQSRKKVPDEVKYAVRIYKEDPSFQSAVNAAVSNPVVLRALFDIPEVNKFLVADMDKVGAKATKMGAKVHRIVQSVKAIGVLAVSVLADLKNIWDELHHNQKPVLKGFGSKLDSNSNYVEGWIDSLMMLALWIIRRCLIKMDLSCEA